MRTYWTDEALAAFALSKLDYLHPRRQAVRNILMGLLNPEVDYTSEPATVESLRDATIRLRGNRGDRDACE